MVGFDYVWHATNPGRYLTSSHRSKHSLPTTSSISNNRRIRLDMLSSLDVSHNFLQDIHLEWLANALTTNVTLQSLNISGNCFTNSAMINIWIPAMPTMKGLTCLDVRHLSQWQSSGIQALQDILPHVYTLQTLYIDSIHAEQEQYPMMDYYLTLNRYGRRYKMDVHNPDRILSKRSGWISILSKAAKAVSSPVSLVTTNQIHPTIISSKNPKTTTTTTTTTTTIKNDYLPSFMTSADILYDLLHGPVLLER